MPRDLPPSGEACRSTRGPATALIDGDQGLASLGARLDIIEHERGLGSDRRTDCRL